MKQKVALYISCRNLVKLDTFSKSDPLAEVYIRENQTTQWALAGKTETMPNNSNPDFATPIECDYFFEKQQHVKVDVYDDDKKGNRDFIGSTITTIGHIFGSAKQTFNADLKDGKHENSRGKLIIRLDAINVS